MPTECSLVGIVLVAIGIVIGIALIVLPHVGIECYQHNRICVKLPQYATGV